MVKKRQQPKRAARFRFEYVTSTVSLLGAAGQSSGSGDGIVVHVVNDNNASENARVVIYQNTGAGAAIRDDSGNVAVAPTWQWGVAFTVTDGGEYWVRIQTTSEFLLPKVSFERLRNGIWTPIVSYEPGNFAAFRLQPSRKRIWSL